MTSVTTTTHRSELAQVVYSARYWAHELPAFSATMRFRANLFQILTASVTALTSLGVWATLEKTPAWWGQVTVAGTTLLATVLVLIPRTMGYTEKAATAQRLAHEYAALCSDLNNAWDALVTGHPWDDEKVKGLIDTFMKLKDEKDTLGAAARPLPEKTLEPADEFGEPGSTRTSATLVMAAVPVIRRR